MALETVCALALCVCAHVAACRHRRSVKHARPSLYCAFDLLILQAIHHFVVTPS